MKFLFDAKIAILILPSISSKTTSNSSRSLIASDRPINLCLESIPKYLLNPDLNET